MAVPWSVWVLVCSSKLGDRPPFDLLGLTREWSTRPVYPGDDFGARFWVSTYQHTHHKTYRTIIWMSYRVSTYFGCHPIVDQSYGHRNRKIMLSKNREHRLTHSWDCGGIMSCKESGEDTERVARFQLLLFLSFLRVPQ